MHSPRFIPGDNWVVCDRCGFDYRRSAVSREWTGLMVCKDCWDPKPIWPATPVDHQSVENARPVQPENFLAPGDVNPEDL